MCYTSTPQLRRSFSGEQVHRRKQVQEEPLRLSEAPAAGPTPGVEPTSDNLEKELDRVFHLLSGHGHIRPPRDDVTSLSP